MTCLACNDEGHVLAFCGRPLTVSFAHGMARLTFYRAHYIALVAALEDLSDDDELSIGVLAAVHYGYDAAKWSRVPCRWCTARVVQGPRARWRAAVDEDEEDLRGTGT